MTAALEGVYDEPTEDMPAGAIVRYEAPAPTLFGTADPVSVIEAATRAAKPLADVVRKQKLSSNIKGREHVRVEGWTLLGSMLGVFPVCVWTRKLENGWEARVEARTRDGAVVGAAEAECLKSESTWASRDDYALRSMAQTRATSKALRQPLGFVMTLAGFDPTPAEEMPSSSERAPSTPGSAAQQATSQFAQPASVQPADDPHGLQASRADAPADGGDPGLVKVFFGKNADKTLGELAPAQRKWYAEKWLPDAKYPPGPKERRLRMAARILCGLPVPETDGPFAAADAASPNPDDDIPF